ARLDHVCHARDARQRVSGAEDDAGADAVGSQHVAGRLADRQLAHADREMDNGFGRADGHRGRFTASNNDVRPSGSGTTRKVPWTENCGSTSHRANFVTTTRILSCWPPTVTMRPSTRARAMSVRTVGGVDQSG